jgi:hypothetical protein
MDPNHMAKTHDMDPTTKDEKRAAAARRHTANLSVAWQVAHDERVREIEAQLLNERVQASAGERLLLRLAAHDAALTDKLAKTELQLAERMLALIDNVQVGASLARTLRQVVACRAVATRRLQELLETAGVLRGQRKLAEVTPLRRVA